MAIDKNDLHSIYQAHHQALYNFAIRWVFDFALAEELVHEAFLALWEKRDTIEVERVKSYLFKTTQNKAINFLRRQKFLAYFALAPECQTDSLETEMLDQEEIKKMKHCLGQLPLNYRKVLLLSYYGEFSQKEISTQLNIAEGTVASRKSRAIDLLKDSFNMGVEYAIS